MTKNLKLLLLALCWLPLSVMAAKLVYLENPPPIPVPAGMPASSVEKVLRSTAAQREWAVKDVAPGQMEFTQSRSSERNSFSATIAVAFDAQKVTLSYKTSNGLDYSDEGNGRYKVHSTYQRWSDTLAKDIKTNLQIFGGKP